MVIVFLISAHPLYDRTETIHQKDIQVFACLPQHQVSLATGEHPDSQTVICLWYENLEEDDEGTRISTWNNKTFQVQENTKSAFLVLVISDNFYKPPTPYKEIFRLFKILTQPANSLH